jgi:hypothetical protein
MRPGEIAGDRVTANYRTLNLIGMDVDDLVPLEEGMRRTIQYFAESEGVEWHVPR